MVKKIQVLFFITGLLLTVLTPVFAASPYDLPENPFVTIHTNPTTVYIGEEDPAETKRYTEFGLVLESITSPQTAYIPGEDTHFQVPVYNTGTATGEAYVQAYIRPEGGDYLPVTTSSSVTVAPIGVTTASLVLPSSPSALTLEVKLEIVSLSAPGIEERRDMFGTEDYSGCSFTLDSKAKESLVWVPSEGNESKVAPDGKSILLYKGETFIDDESATKINWNYYN